MADFGPIMAATIEREGGYKLTNDPDDSGGMTYAGISRTRNPGWPGWAFIDAKRHVPNEIVDSFYKSVYWDEIRGDRIHDQAVAESLYDFGVNAGPAVSRTLAQRALGVNPDGVFGPVTIEALNTTDAKAFLERFALQKIGRYLDIVDRRPKDLKYFHGWIARTMQEVAL